MRVTVEGDYARTAEEERDRVQRLLKALEPVFPDAVRDLLEKAEAFDEHEGGVRSNYPVVEAQRQRDAAAYRLLLRGMIGEIADAVDAAMKVAP